MITITPFIKSFMISFTPSKDLDISGYKIYGVPASSLEPGATDFIPTGDNKGDGNCIEEGPDTMYTIPVDTGGEWFIKVAAYDTFGEDVLNYSTVRTVVVATTDPLDQVAPDAPSWGTCLTGIDSSGVQDNIYISLSWLLTEPEDFSNYVLAYKKSADLNWTEVLTATKTHRLNNLISGITYQFQIKAVDRWNNSSDFVSYNAGNGLVAAKDSVAPATPSGLSAVSAFKNVFVKWSANTESDFKEYILQVDDNAGFTASEEFRCSTNSFTYQSAAGITSYFKVSAVDYSGNASVYSGVVSATTALVVAVDIAAATITATQIANGTIDLGGTKITGLLANANLTQITDSTKIADSLISNSKLAELSVDANKLANSAVTSTKIANAAVGTAAIANAAITNALIANLAVGSAQIADAAITNAKIGALAVGSAQIVDAAITNAKIGLLAVNTANIVDAAISNAKIGTLVADKITSGTLDCDLVTMKNLTFTDLTGGITWTNVASKPTTVSEFNSTDGTTLSTAKSDATSAVNQLTTLNAVGGKLTYIGSDGLYSGTVNVNKLTAGTFAGGGIGLSTGATVNLDGTNARIAVNDGTRDRVYIGKLGTGDYGVDIQNAAGLSVVKVSNTGGAVIQNATVGNLTVSGTGGILCGSAASAFKVWESAAGNMSMYLGNTGGQSIQWDGATLAINAKVTMGSGSTINWDNTGMSGTTPSSIANSSLGDLVRSDGTTVLGSTYMYTGTLGADNITAGTITASVSINTPNINIKDDSITGVPSISKGKGAIIGNNSGDIFVNIADGVNWSKIWDEKTDESLRLKVQVTSLFPVAPYAYPAKPMLYAPLVMCRHGLHIIAGGLAGNYTTSMPIWYLHDSGIPVSDGSLPWSGFTAISAVMLAMDSDYRFHDASSLDYVHCIIGGVGGRLAFCRTIACVTGTNFVFTSFSIPGLTGDIHTISAYGGDWILGTSTGQIWQTVGAENPTLAINWVLSIAGFTFSPATAFQGSCIFGYRQFIATSNQVYVRDRYYSDTWSLMNFYSESGVVLGNIWPYAGGILSMQIVDSYVYITGYNAIFSALVTELTRLEEILNITNLGATAGYFTSLVGTNKVLMARAYLAIDNYSTSYTVCSTDSRGSTGTWGRSPTIMPAGGSTMGSVTKRFSAVSYPLSNSENKSFVLSGDLVAGVPVYSSPCIM